MSTQPSEEENALQRISEIVGAPFLSEAEDIVRAVQSRDDAVWNAAIEAAAEKMDEAKERHWSGEDAASELIRAPDVIRGLKRGAK